VPSPGCIQVRIRSPILVRLRELSTPPTRSNSRSWRTRSKQSSLGRGHRLLQEYVRYQPIQAPTAVALHVNAPFSCPNSSDAISEAVCGQFTRIKARRAIGSLCMARNEFLSSSVSPESEQLNRLAHLCTCDNTRRALEDPTISSNIEERSILRATRDSRFGSFLVAFTSSISCRLHTADGSPFHPQRFIDKNQRYAVFRSARCRFQRRPRNSAASRSSCSRSRSSGWKTHARSLKRSRRLWSAGVVEERWFA